MVWDALSDADAGSVLDGFLDQAIALGGDPEDVAGRLREGAAAALVSRAKALGSKDNIAALVAFF